MKDTPDEIIKIQRQIMHRKTMQERFALGAELFEMGRNMVANDIKRLNPGIEEIDLKIEVFKRIYRNELSPEFMENAIKSMRKFLEEENNRA